MVAPITVEQIIEYYSNLLIIQYKSKQKAMATIALIAEIQANNNIQFDVESAFDIATAVGKQLDILGKYIGVDRSYQGTDYPDNTFGFCDYNDDIGTGQTGFTDYADYATQVGTTLTYADIIGNQQMLDDDDYRTILKLQIATNSSNMSQKSIDDQLFNIFGDEVILTTTNHMEIWYFVSPDIGVLENVLIQKKVLPKPMAVRIAGIIVAEDPTFAFTSYGQSNLAIENDVLVEGFSEYSNYSSKLGQTLTYDDIII